MPRPRHLVAAGFALACGLAVAPLRAAPIAPGKSEQVAQLGDLALKVYSYRPSCPNPSLLMVFHGESRKAGVYRTLAIPIAERLCMTVVAPLFDKRRFPTWSYQRGGIVAKDKVRDPHRWTGRVVDALATWASAQEERPLAYSLLGHSAGAQFLSRVAAFVPTAAKHIVIANPSTYVSPTLDVAAPFGLGGVYPPAEAEAALRRYLAQPVTIMLGTADRGSKNNSPQAEAQGADRFTRGHNVFAAAQKLAAAHGWPFGWRLIEVPGVRHSAGRMFGSPQAVEALQ
jgi:hypothetical protein